VKRRKAVNNGERVGKRGGFNGAVAVKRRKDVHVFVNDGGSVALQWGRRCEATEGYAQTKAKIRDLRLQWGRRCEATEGGKE